MLIRTGTANIPYTITSYTPGKPSEECVENGNLAIKYAWDVTYKAASTDQGIKK